MKRAFVTGASGFIGRHLVRRLTERGVAVHTLARVGGRHPQPSGKNDHRWDGSTQGLMEIVAAAQPDAVFHLASCFVADHTPSQIEDIVLGNILLGTQVLEAMAAAGIHRLVNFGTSWQHYQNQPYNPVCLYAATKQAFEDVLKFYAESRGISAITLKLFDTYGPDDDRAKLFAALARCLTTGESLNLSPGEQQVDFAFVEDVADAALAAADRLMERHSLGLESYGVSGGQPMSLRDFVQTVAEVAGRPLAVNWGARPYRSREVMTLWRDFSPLPGWSPRWSLTEGIKTTLDSHV